MVYKYASKSLRDFITKNGKSNEPCPQEEACQFLSQLARALQKLHSKFIVHRDLRMEAIKVRSKKQRVYLQIGQFDFSLQLKKNHTVLQTFNVSRPLAPEIQAGQPHDMAVDVWALGQIGYQLLCCPNRDEVLEVSERMNGAAVENQLDFLLGHAGNQKWRDGSIDLSLRQLIASMVLTDPQHRPVMDEIVKHPMLSFGQE